MLSSGWEESREGGALDTHSHSPLPPSVPPGLMEILCLSPQALPSPEGWQTEEGPSWPQVPLISQDRGETSYPLTGSGKLGVGDFGSGWEGGSSFDQ